MLNYDDDDCSQGYGQIKEAFGALTKNYILQPYISDNDFGSFPNDKNIGYNSYVSDIRCSKSLEPAQPIKVEFEFSAIVPVGIYGYALVLTNNWLAKARTVSVNLV